jgi:protein-S-isoprenylcysteine O-methyltransferase Ste14
MEKAELAQLSACGSKEVQMRAAAQFSGSAIPAFVRLIVAEERMLTDQFGKEYLAYRAKTWKLVPFFF